MMMKYVQKLQVPSDLSFCFIPEYKLLDKLSSTLQVVVVCCCLQDSEFIMVFTPLFLHHQAFTFTKKM